MRAPPSSRPQPRAEPGALATLAREGVDGKVDIQCRLDKRNRNKLRISTWSDAASASDGAGQVGWIRPVRQCSPDELVGTEKFHSSPDSLCEDSRQGAQGGSLSLFESLTSRLLHARVLQLVPALHVVVPERHVRVSFEDVLDVLDAQRRVREECPHELDNLVRRKVDKVGVVEQEEDVRLCVVSECRTSDRTYHRGLEQLREEDEFEPDRHLTSDRRLDEVSNVGRAVQRRTEPLSPTKSVSSSWRLLQSLLSRIDSSSEMSSWSSISVSTRKRTELTSAPRVA